MFADCPKDSGPTTKCDPNKEYPYLICEEDDKGNKVRKEVCTNDPNSLPNIIKVDLPIRIVNEYSIAQEKFKTPLVGGSQRIGWQMHPDFNNADLQTAANKWNCICAYEGDAIFDVQLDEYEERTGTTIIAKFSNNFKDFPDPYSDRSSFNKDDISKDDCSLSNPTMYFNITPEFELGIPSPNNPDQNAPEKPIYHALMNNNFIMDDLNWSYIVGSWFDRQDVPYEIYNFIDIAIRQIGEILGMGWSDDCGCKSYDNSVMSPTWFGNWQINGWPGGLSPYFGLGGAENSSSGDCDKCMFQKLYCPEVSIYEYASPEQNLYPNPARKTTSIEFTLPTYTDNLKMFIMNPIGQVISLVKENGIYDAGTHIEPINIEGLSTGPYFLIIEAGTYRIVKPFIVTNY